MPNRREFDHLFNGKFSIEIEGVTQGAFVACDGLEAKVDVVTFTDGGLQAVLEHSMLSSLQLEDNTCALVKCWRLKLLQHM